MNDLIIIDTVASVVTAEIIENVVKSFIDEVNEIDKEAAMLRAIAFADAFDERSAFECRKNVDNDSIQKQITKNRAKFISLQVARFMIATNVNATFVNESEHDGARRNVYAHEKLAFLAESVVYGKKFNAVNYHCLRSLFKFANKDLEFTHADALAATSDKIKVEHAKKRANLSRHTVSASTASTQASSTMIALVACGVVSEYKNETRDVCYKLTDNAIVAHLRSLIMS